MAADLRLELDPTRPRPVGTYKRRGGRWSDRKTDLVTRLGPVWSLALPPAGPIEMDAAFGRRAPRVLEIGSGDGEAAAAHAAAHPERDHLCVEVHRAGIAELLDRIDRAGLTNVRVVEGDAVDLLDRLPAGSLTEVHVWFPDPWPKRRHHDRRLLRPAVLADLARLLAPEGRLRVATDWAPYAAEVRAAVALTPRLAVVGGPEGARPAWRPVTAYERRGRDAGRAVTELVARRV